VAKNLRIVITGPESTGKTTLAQELAGALGTFWVPEFARFYVSHLGRLYERSDLYAIGCGQKRWETWYRQQQEGILVLDTDWTVLHVWEAYRFEPAPQPVWRQGYGEPVPADLYVLCTPDFPWTPDPLREHPNEQYILFEWYLALLKDLNTPFILAEGPPSVRLEKVLETIRNL
jgi:nicotinamide riboside kinase